MFSMKASQGGAPVWTLESSDEIGSIHPLSPDVGASWIVSIMCKILLARALQSAFHLRHYQGKLEEVQMNATLEPKPFLAEQDGSFTL